MRNMHTIHRGTVGVLVTKKNGHKVLLGSDDPGRLAAVIRAAVGY